jgi:hypothetical protein
MSNGTSDLVRSLPGVSASLVEPFVAALAQAAECFEGLPAALETARVHDTAFGKLIDAEKVRDAYHQRLPATATNLAEARAVLEHLRAQFAAVEPPPPADSVPHSRRPDAAEA